MCMVYVCLFMYTHVHGDRCEYSRVLQRIEVNNGYFLLSLCGYVGVALETTLTNFL